MESSNQLTAEDYNVYSDLLKQMVKPQKLFIIRDRTKSEVLDERGRKYSLEYMKKILDWNKTMRFFPIIIERMNNLTH